jgi:hypothetical protein
MRAEIVHDARVLATLSLGDNGLLLAEWQTVQNGDDPRMWMAARALWRRLCVARPKTADDLRRIASMEPNEVTIRLADGR